MQSTAYSILEFFSIILFLGWGLLVTFTLSVLVEKKFKSRYIMINYASLSNETCYCFQLILKFLECLVLSLCAE